MALLLARLAVVVFVKITSLVVFLFFLPRHLRILSSLTFIRVRKARQTLPTKSFAFFFLFPNFSLLVKTLANLSDLEYRLFSKTFRGHRHLVVPEVVGVLV